VSEEAAVVPDDAGWAVVDDPVLADGWDPAVVSASVAGVVADEAGSDDDGGVLLTGVVSGVAAAELSLGG
jgi:hypothetical protein